MSLSLFVSHGAPTLAIDQNSTTEFLRTLGIRLPRPKTILCISAHWTTALPEISTAANPETVHDFGGFSRELYEISYPAPGARDLAKHVIESAGSSGIIINENPTRGLDHGAWVPLRLIFPKADIPVTQLSIQPDMGPEGAFRLGRSLRGISNDDVLILGTGSVTHNLRRIDPAGAPPDWAIQFDKWICEKVTGGDVEALLNYRRLAPFAEIAHPTDEHLLPLFATLGAAADPPNGILIHKGWTYGSLSMSAFSFPA